MTRAASSSSPATHSMPHRGYRSVGFSRFSPPGAGLTPTIILLCLLVASSLTPGASGSANTGVRLSETPPVTPPVTPPGTPPGTPLGRSLGEVPPPGGNPIGFVKNAECENGNWTHQTPDGLPHVNCARNPVCVRHSAITEERCRVTWKDDKDWPLVDPYIKRSDDWHSAASLLHLFPNQNVWFVGDSIMTLLWNGLKCEMWRHGAVFDQIIPPDLFAEAKAVGVGLWEAWTFPETNTTFFRMGWHKVIKNDWEFMLKHGEVFVFDFGLHYQTIDEYEVDMLWLFERISNTKGKTGVYWELPAQHFPKGSYDAATQKNDEGTMVCGVGDPAMLYNAESNTVWNKTVIAHRMIREHNFNILALPFYNLTSVRGDMTEGRFCQAEGRRINPDNVCLDCTHYCHTPLLWAKVASDLYSVLNTGAEKAIEAAASGASLGSASDHATHDRFRVGVSLKMKGHAQSAVEGLGRAIEFLKPLLTVYENAEPQ